MCVAFRSSFYRAPIHVIAVILVPKIALTADRCVSVNQAQVIHKFNKALPSDPNVVLKPFPRSFSFVKGGRSSCIVNSETRLLLKVFLLFAVVSKHYAYFIISRIS